MLNKHRVLFVAAIALALWSHGASAQSLPFGTTFGASKQNIIRLRDSANRLCLNLKGTVRQEAVNKEINDHVILAENICSKIIRVKACYFRSSRCVEFDIHSREKKEVLLGAMPRTPEFRFEYTEKQLF